jgi:hypothetical protein
MKGSAALECPACENDTGYITFVGRCVSRQSLGGISLALRERCGFSTRSLKVGHSSDATQHAEVC